MKDLWTDTPLSDLLPDLEIPHWIEEGLTDSDISAICQGGCASGAYMPAVTYFQARETMNEHGDDILTTMYELGGCDPLQTFNVQEQSWEGFACYLVSYAVEAWASTVLAELEDLEDDSPA